MKRKYEEEIAANLERAEASIRAAQGLVVESYCDFAASRAFYAATAVLLCEELEFSKHSGVIAFIHREFVKTKRLDKKYGKNLNWLFELRGVGDYGATIHVSRRDAEKAIRVAEEFLRAIEGLIREKDSEQQS